MPSKLLSCSLRFFPPCEFLADRFISLNQVLNSLAETLGPNDTSSAFSLFSGRLPYCSIADSERCDRAPTLATSDTGREAQTDLRLKEPTSVEPRPDGVLIDSRLRCNDGFLCDLCPFRTISKPMIARHLNREHFRATTVRWARSHATTASSSMPVYLQAWDASSNNTAAAYTELRSWLERTGWERVYANVDRRLLYSLTLRPVERSYRPLLLSAGMSQLDNDIVSPADDEAKIAAFCHAAYNAISRCEETARTSSRNSLCWLRSVHPNNCFPKPLTPVARNNTRARDISVLQRFVSLICRAYRSSTNLRRDVAGVSLTEEHWVACGKSLNTGISADCACEDTGEVSDRDGWEEDDSDLDDQQSLASSNDDKGSQFGDPEESFSGDSSQNECDTSINTQYPGKPEAEGVEAAGSGSLDELLFELIMQFCTQESQDGDPSQTLLVYFSRILGFTKDFQSFQLPRNYTSHLAALTYIQRLLFLDYALPKRGYAEMGKPERSRQGSLARLRDVRHRFTVLGAESPFEEMFSLLCFGRKIAANSTPPIVLHWSDDEQTMTASGACSVTMDNFRSLPKDLVAKADQLCRELLYHLPPIEDLEHVQDDFAKTDAGFSFLHHPANKLSKEYLNLCNRACAGTEARLASNGKWRYALV
ncbi:hypothetical protein BDP55DRAFT_637759 [Colletotrichum godetiae]|uniref:Uncharacterized protein n=1 Tax=Colletotrichum godetiae TaxID=1209918 RepID=A0AAJ0ERI8_9PEZI|nr:uncharacterized protein BDP55DRAFT_637759 [Colletotrichum godetiae]KAK1658533.1 hypothetical protein BDP55DRAFT_637759 [Colletotrichum godetiae]